MGCGGCTRRKQTEGGGSRQSGKQDSAIASGRAKVLNNSLTSGIFAKLLQQTYTTQLEVLAHRLAAVGERWNGINVKQKVCGRP